MGLVSTLLNSTNWKFEKYLKTFQFRNDIVDTIGVIWNKSNPEEIQRQYNKNLTDFLNFEEYLPENQIDLLRKNSLSTINYFYSEDKDGKPVPLFRESGEPYPIHSIDVQYILRAVNATLYSLIAGMNHDNVEHRIEEEKKTLKKQDKELSNEALDDILDKVTGEQLNRLLIHNVQGIDSKDLAKSIIVLQKVTRFESDENYYQSIDRIFSRDINENTLGLKTFFRNFQERFGELTFERREITDIIDSAACVKLADRIANTLDTFKGQKFSDKLRILYKNMYAINKLTEYINKSENGKTINSKSFKQLKELKETLIRLNLVYLGKEKEDMLNRCKSDNFFKPLKALLDKEMINYAKSEGFRLVDYGFDTNPYSGNIRRIWDKLIKKDADAISQLETTPFEQYIAITGFLEIIKSFGKGETVEGFSTMAKDQKLGYYDDMGEKYSDEWREKRRVREFFKVKSTESFYRKAGKEMTYRISAK